MNKTFEITQIYFDNTNLPRGLNGKKSEKLNLVTRRERRTGDEVVSNLKESLEIKVNVVFLGLSYMCVICHQRALSRIFIPRGYK